MHVAQVAANLDIGLPTIWLMLRLMAQAVALQRRGGRPPPHSDPVDAINAALGVARVRGRTVAVFAEEGVTPSTER
jgi:hypothetical protein